MNPVLGMVMDLIWVIAFVVFWILYLIDTKREDDNVKQQTRRIGTMLIFIFAGIFSFILAFSATITASPPYPWHSTLDFITMFSFVALLFIISMTKWSTAFIIFLVVTFASALAAVIIRTFVIYIPIIKGFF